MAPAMAMIPVATAHRIAALAVSAMLDHHATAEPAAAEARFNAEEAAQVEIQPRVIITSRAALAEEAE